MSENINQNPQPEPDSYTPTPDQEAYIDRLVNQGFNYIEATRAVMGAEYMTEDGARLVEKLDNGTLLYEDNEGNIEARAPYRFQQTSQKQKRTGDIRTHKEKRWADQPPEHIQKKIPRPERRRPEEQ